MFEVELKYRRGVRYPVFYRINLLRRRRQVATGHKGSQSQAVYIVGQCFNSLFVALS